MTTSEYTKQLEAAKNRAESQFNDLSQLEKDVLDTAFQWLVENVKIDSGKFSVTEDLNKIMNDFVNTVLSSIHANDQYAGAMVNYLHDMNVIGQNMDKFQKDSNNVDFDKAGVRDVQKVIIQDTIDRYTENGLNEGFVQPLKDLMLRNVVAGVSLRDAKNILTDYIISGKDTTGKLSRYLIQTAQQGVDSYTGAINTKLKQTFNYTGMVISGSLIETSSEQCVMAVEMAAKTGGYLTNKQWEEILQVAKNNKKAALIEGTTLENLPVNKLHWGCRC